jgi:hypothetical protein
MVELKKLNMQLLYEPSIPILGIYLRKNWKQDLKEKFIHIDSS